MDAESAATAVIDLLNARGVPYMLVGSLASNLYGVARATQDADFVLQAEKRAISDLAAGLGKGFRLDPQVRFETVTATTHFVLELEGISFRVDLFLLSDDTHDQERFRRRRQVRVFGRQTFVPTVEDMVITKLRWCRQSLRTKDADDLRNMISVQADRIDWPYVYAWCDRHGTRGMLEAIRASLPPP